MDIRLLVVKFFGSFRVGPNKQLTAATSLPVLSTLYSLLPPGPLCPPHRCCCAPTGAPLNTTAPPSPRPRALPCSCAPSLERRAAIEVHEDLFELISALANQGIASFLALAALEGVGARAGRTHRPPS